MENTINSHISKSLKTSDASFNSKQLLSLIEDLSVSELKAVLYQLETKVDSIHFNQSQILQTKEQLLEYYNSIFLNSDVFYTFYLSLAGASINVKEIRGASKKKFQERQIETSNSIRRFYQQEVIDAVEVSINQLDWIYKIRFLFNSSILFKMIKANTK